MDTHQQSENSWTRLEPQEDTGRSWRLAWPLALALAWLAFELTASPTLTILVACLKFGLEDVRTACWFRRADPDRPRGKATFWFYLSSGIWKTAIAPVAIVFVISILWVLFAPRGLREKQEWEHHMASAIGIGAAAAGVLLVVVTIAIVTTLLASCKVWVHHHMHHARRSDQWPPPIDRATVFGENRGRAILATALFVATIALPICLFPMIVFVAGNFELGLTLGLVFGIPIGAVVVYASLRDRLFAISPDECWPETL